MFTGERKNFFHFEKIFRRQLATKKIAYIFDEQEITEINTDSFRQAYEAMSPGRVDEAKKRGSTTKMVIYQRNIMHYVHLSSRRGTSSSFTSFKPLLLWKDYAHLVFARRSAKSELNVQQLQFQFGETWRMLIRDHEPQGDRTAAVWENKLDHFTMDRGVVVAIPTFKECLLKMERTLRYNPDGTPVASPDVTLRSYRPLGKNLRIMLLKTLDTASTGSPFRRLTGDMRLTYHLDLTSHQIR
jgi:hypothetical protein